MFANLFSGDIWTKLRNNPQTAPFLNQPDFVQKLSEIQANPNKLNEYLPTDQRIVAALGVLMGIPMKAQPADTNDNNTEETRSPPPKKEPEPKKEEKVVPELTEDEKKALEEKEKGNAAYKARDFDTAIKHYTEAMKYDPKNVILLTNRAGMIISYN
jgi:stress-induced-phosphoprotein 1